jgi:hypothetical protein
MASRITKHDHDMAIISHYDDYSAVLAMCQMKPCSNTMTMKPGRIKVAERKFRPESMEEFMVKVNSMKHLCCE